jgi:hypothetical protein
VRADGRELVGGVPAYEGTMACVSPSRVLLAGWSPFPQPDSDSPAASLSESRSQSASHPTGSIRMARGDPGDTPRPVRDQNHP